MDDPRRWLGESSDELAEIDGVVLKSPSARLESASATPSVAKFSPLMLWEGVARSLAESGPDEDELYALGIPRPNRTAAA